MTEQELQTLLSNFATAVSNVDLTDKRKINFFSATKMLTLETKHSALFAWLIDSSKEHCLGSAVLQKVLKKLYAYRTNATKKVPNPKSNAEILQDDRGHSETAILNEEQAVALAQTEDIAVDTEVYTDGGTANESIFSSTLRKRRR